MGVWVSQTSSGIVARREERDCWGVGVDVDVEAWDGRWGVGDA